jgi:hypothetical protein
MTEYNGNHVKAAVSGPLMKIENATGSISAALTKDEALDLQAALAWLVKAMPVGATSQHCERIPGRGNNAGQRTK